MTLREKEPAWNRGSCLDAARLETIALNRMRPCMKITDEDMPHPDHRMTIRMSRVVMISTVDNHSGYDVKMPRNPYFTRLPRAEGRQRMVSYSHLTTFYTHNIFAYIRLYNFKRMKIKVLLKEILCCG